MDDVFDAHIALDMWEELEHKIADEQNRKLNG